MFSWDEYWGKFCPSMVIDCISANATALINYKLRAASYPPWCVFTPWGTVQSPSALICLDWYSNILFRTPYHPVLLVLLNAVGTPWPGMGPPLFYSRLFTPFGAALLGCMLLCCIGSPQSLLALLGMDLYPLLHSLLLYHLLYSPCPPCTLHIRALLFSWWCTSFSSEYLIVAFQTPFWFTTDKHLNSTLVRNHKLSQPTLQLYFTLLPGQNLLPIQQVPPACLQCW